MPQDVRMKAKEKNIEIRLFNIIYRLVENLKAEIEAKLPMTEKEEIIGRVEISHENVP